VTISSQAWTLLCDDAGKVLHHDDKQGYESGVSSPDGEYWVFNNGLIRRADNFANVKNLFTHAESHELVCHFIPHWNRELDFLSRHRALGQRWTGAGQILRFHPVGRRIPSRRFGLSLAPQSSALLSDGTIASYHSSPNNGRIAKWSKDGELISVGENKEQLASDFHGWNSIDHQVTLYQYASCNLATYDLDGKQIVFQAGNFRSPIWSENPRRLSAVDYAADGGAIRVFESNQEIYRTRTAFKTYIFPHGFSANGRWLAWVYPDENGVDQLSVVDIEQASSPNTYQLEGAGFYRDITFSPDSNTLLVRSTATPSTFSTLILNLNTNLVSRQTLSGNHSYTVGIKWAQDSRCISMGALYQLDSELKLQPVSSSVNAGQHPRFSTITGRTPQLVAQKDAFLPTIQFSKLDGTELGSFGLTFNTLAASWLPQQRQAANDEIAICRLANPRNMPAALQTINMAGQSAGWTGAFFEDDQSVVLDSAGNILHCPDNLDRYLIRTIHYPGGTVVPVTTAEFWKRVATSRGCSFESSQLETLGSLRSLESLSLAGCVIDDFGLLELQRIQNLKALDLSNSSVSPAAVAKLQEKLPNCSIRFKPD
jgi:hypothetical protein